jgi:hypothetical protein
MFDSPKGPWEIVPFARSSTADQYVAELDRPEVERFLRQFKADYSVMSRLRGLLAPTDPVSRFTDDQVIKIIAWRLATRELWFRKTVRRYSSRSAAAGSGGGGKAQPDQSASKQSALQSSGTRNVLQDSQASRPKKSWFSITVMQELAGAEKVVEGLTLSCHLPDLGETSGVTSSGSPHVRFDNLDPGGAGDVLGTSHDEVVWEVTEDI